MYSEGRLRSMEKIIQKEKKEDFNFHLYKCFIHFVLIKKDLLGYKVNLVSNVPRF
jgi:hypothetical protein